MINVSFPAIEFHDFYIHYSNSSIVLFLSALLLTVYMFVQDSTVHILSRDREHITTVIKEHRTAFCVRVRVIPNLSNHSRRLLVVEEVQNLLFASEDILGDLIPKLRNLEETF